jgi:hypothetical protein
MTSEPWDGRERPAGPELLAAARQTLVDRVVPQLSGDARFQALMVANAMAIALREARSAGSETAAAVRSVTALAADGDIRSLTAEIRAGIHDPRAPTHEAVGRALTALAEARCRISAPKALG